MLSYKVNTLTRLLSTQFLCGIVAAEQSHTTKAGANMYDLLEITIILKREECMAESWRQVDPYQNNVFRLIEKVNACRQSSFKWSVAHQPTTCMPILH